MNLGRRDFVVAWFAAGAYALFQPAGKVNAMGNMYGLIGKMIAVDGKRDALSAILLEGLDNMPGCLSYVVANDPKDKNAVWITEVWDSKESHAASLQLPSVQSAIARARPMLAGFGERFETEPLGGLGLSKGKS